MRTFIILGVLLIAATALVRAADLTGKWTAEFDTQIGVQKYTFTFKTEGDKLTGKALANRMGQDEEVTLTDVVVKGDDVTFTETLNFQGQEVPIKYTGKITGDEIKFTRKVGEFATEELVAKRKKD
jgi:hypothetical protein